MTKKLEELLDLEPLEKTSKKTKKPPVHQKIKSSTQTTKMVKQLTDDLPQIAELENLGESELDSLAKTAEDAFNDLMDLGMNVEVRYSGRIFEVASSMLKNAIDAKNAKIDKKLKAVELQLRKAKLDKSNEQDPNGILNGEGYVITDRNDLLKKLSQKG